MKTVMSDVDYTAVLVEIWFCVLKMTKISIVALECGEITKTLSKVIKDRNSSSISVEDSIEDRVMGTYNFGI